MGKKSRRKIKSKNGNDNDRKHRELIRDIAADLADASFGPSTPIGRAAKAARSNNGNVEAIFNEATEKHYAPLPVNAALCDEISELPLTENIYMVDVHSTTQQDEDMPSGYATEHHCVCGLVVKEHGSNGKHWNNTGIGHVESKADGLSLTMAVSATMNDTQTVDYNFDRSMILGTIAKACKNPGALNGDEAMKHFWIKPSRPRKIVLVSEGMMMSIAENLKHMGIPELAIADAKLAGSMRSSFSEGTDLNPSYELNMQRAIESGNMSAISRAYGQHLIDTSNSYYVSEKRQPLGSWKPDPILDANTPKEWYARPPSAGSCRNRMLWGWRTNLELASERNDSRKIKDLCKQYPPDEVKEFVESRLLLMKAAGLGSAKACRALLKYANAAVDGVRSTSNQQKWVPIQEDAGDSGKCKGMTPLFKAIQEGQQAVVDLLVDHHGANVQLSPHSAPYTPLHLAVARGHPAIVESLIFAGADVNVTDGSGCTPLQINQSFLDWGEYGTKQYEKIAKILETMDTRIKRCAACHAKAPKLLCPCLLHRYCGAECQRKMWKSHKREHREAMEVWKV